MGSTTAIRVLFAALAIGFFAAPIAARVAGVTADTFENRKLADAPKLSQGWNAFQQTSRYLTDRMPLRAQAVRANTRIWTDVLGTDPRYGQQTALAQDEALPFAGAIEDGAGARLAQGGGGLRGPAAARTGRGGWLYVPMEFSVACDKSVPDELVLQRWARLVDAIRAKGRKTALFVVPHKASVYPEHLPESYPHEDCALPAKERFWRLLSSDGPALDVHELRSELLRLKENAGDGLFQRTDMHWSTLGALTLVRTVLDELGEGVRLEPSEIVPLGSATYTGDLSLASGDPRADKRIDYGIERAAGAARVPGRTLVICDSFAYIWMRLFEPYFEDVRHVSWYGSDRRILDAVRQSDRVIVETDEVLMKVQARPDEMAVSIARALRASGP